MKEGVRFKASLDIPKRIIDPTAETIEELNEQSAGRGINWMYNFAKRMVATGKWEQVFKVKGGRCVFAYRRKP